MISFFHGFFKYIKKQGSPIDFFSWHSYADINQTSRMDKWLNEQLVAYGYEDLETHLNEWDPYASERGTPHHSAGVAAMMIALREGIQICAASMICGQTTEYIRRCSTPKHRSRVTLTNQW